MKGGIGKALGVRMAEADWHCHGSKARCRLRVMLYRYNTTVHTFLVSYSSRVVVVAQF